jgi:hypothetical protein
MNMMRPDWKEDKRQMKGQLEDLWRDVEAFAREGKAVHEVERHLFRQVLALGFALLLLVVRICGYLVKNPSRDGAGEKRACVMQALYHLRWRQRVSEFRMAGHLPREWSRQRREVPAAAHG